MCVGGHKRKTANRPANTHIHNLKSDPHTSFAALSTNCLFLFCLTISISIWPLSTQLCVRFSLFHLAANVLAHATTTSTTAATTATRPTKLSMQKALQTLRSKVNSNTNNNNGHIVCPATPTYLWPKDNMQSGKWRGRAEGEGVEEAGKQANKMKNCCLWHM